ncbi:MAG TPA: hypothetical protein VMW32_10920 [Bacteroidales bacterium]|nr:hypothetical protein [Bacteroidales bacterium]
MILTAVKRSCLPGLLYQVRYVVPLDTLMLLKLIDRVLGLVSPGVGCDHQLP